MRTYFHTLDEYILTTILERSHSFNLHFILYDILPRSRISMIDKIKSDRVDNNYSIINLIEDACKEEFIDILESVGLKKFIKQSLFIAATTNRPYLVQQLMSRVGSVKSSLMTSLSKGHLQVVKLLIDRENGLDQMLSFAVSGNLETVKYLVGRGATNFNEALTEACKWEKREIIDYLMERATHFYPINAVKVGDIETVKRMVEKGASLRQGHILTAVQYNRPKMLKYLLDRNIDCKELSLYDIYEYDITKILLKKEILQAWTVLIGIMRSGKHERLIWYILDNYEFSTAKINILLLEAVKQEDIDLTVKLIKMGASNLDDCAVKAAQLNNFELINLFLNRGANVFN